MMYVLIGKEGKEKGAMRRTLIDKRGFEEINLSLISPEELATYAATPSLMGDTSIFLISGAFSDAESRDAFLSLTEQFIASPHTFIFEEEKLLKKEADKLRKKGAEVETFDTPKVESFNVFLLANALGAKKKKELWILLIKALRSGIAPENIAGVLHWKVRSLLSSSGSKVYSRDELIALSRAIVVMYHDAHRGKGPLELLLERFALTLS